MADAVSQVGGTDFSNVGMPPAALLVDCGITRLEAEPQSGPTEYKLHLLLRPRRSFSASSTVQHVSGSYQSKAAQTPWLESESKISPAKLSPVSAPSSQSRQNRLQHLTTQLLWRLQQSSPYHSSSTSDLVVPVLPESTTQHSALTNPGRPLPGLEESQGALYEIGVSDDGTFVGLTQDELEESLKNLDAMAFSLGCKVEVLRMVIVGDCQWSENYLAKGRETSKVHEEKLWVAEALVTPNLAFENRHTSPSPMTPGSPTSLLDRSALSAAENKKAECRTEQLRVSLTGSTTSGKSSLLGTLSTSTPDNGRGKSRLSLLKHRHEISSGATSSVTPELIGYRDTISDDKATGSRANVINYASGNVSSWNDIHSATNPGRLVFMTDSAGHPKFRRTTLRGLISWAPHWTMCCVAADDGEDTTGKTGATASASDVLGSLGVGMDLSKAHLELCLQLKLSLIVVITKLDLATKSGLRQTLAKVLSIVKSAGRQPAILSTSSSKSQDSELQFLVGDEEDEVKLMLSSHSNSDINSVVPIVLTSALTGSGIAKVHALLRHLPISRLGDHARPGSCSKAPRNLFQIDEVFNILDTHTASRFEGHAATHSTILSGYMSHGSISIGEELVVGPFTISSADESLSQTEIHQASSFPGQAKSHLRSKLAKHYLRRSVSGDFVQGIASSEASCLPLSTWQKVRIVSLRNLRLPVPTLLADQVGTVGVSLNGIGITLSQSIPTNAYRIRKGMVMMNVSSDLGARPPLSYRGFVAVFNEGQGLSVFSGSLVIVYIGSIRASAKAITVKDVEFKSFSDDLSALDDTANNDDGAGSPVNPDRQEGTEIAFQFLSTREWFELESQVLVMLGGGPGLAVSLEHGNKGGVGLEGNVGRITRALI